MRVYLLHIAAEKAGFACLYLLLNEQAKCLPAFARQYVCRCRICTFSPTLKITASKPGSCGSWLQDSDFVMMSLSLNNKYEGVESSCSYSKLAK